MMPDSRVLSFAVVVNLDVFEYGHGRASPRRVPDAMDQFDLERMEKTLHCSIVVAIGPASHAAT